AARAHGLEPLRALAFEAAESLGALPADALRHTARTGTLGAHVPPDARALRPDAETRATEARARLVARYLGYALRIAVKYARQPELYLDLCQEAADGLLEAVERFDHREQTFKPYATSWMFQRVMKAYADYGHIVRRPMNRLKGLAKRERAL